MKAGKCIVVLGALFVVAATACGPAGGEKEDTRREAPERESTSVGRELRAYFASTRSAALEASEVCASIVSDGPPSRCPDCTPVPVICATLDGSTLSFRLEMTGTHGVLCSAAVEVKTSAPLYSGDPLPSPVKISPHVVELGSVTVDNEGGELAVSATGTYAMTVEACE